MMLPFTPTSAPGRQQEPIEVDRSLIEQVRDESRAAASRTVAGLCLVPPQTPVWEQKTDRNVFVLGPGKHRGFRLTRPDTTVMALGDAWVTGHVQVDAPGAILVGLRFENDGNRLVTVGAAGGAALVNCRFRKGATAPMGAGGAGLCYVCVLNGGLATLHSCVFEGLPAAGVIIDNQSALASVGVIGCENRTGQVHANTTVIFEV